MFDRSACAKVRLAVEPHTNLSALVMLGALLRQHQHRCCHADPSPGRFRIATWAPPGPSPVPLQRVADPRPQ